LELKATQMDVIIRRVLNMKKEVRIKIKIKKMREIVALMIISLRLGKKME